VQPISSKSLIRCTTGFKSSDSGDENMTGSFESTWLWRSAFADNRNPRVTEAEKEFFRQHFLGFRDRVKPLVARIAQDMPGLTVHDITHLDALWETGSLVAEPALALNPPEAFVFGGAVLLHDAAMTLAAYPGGIAELKATTKWADIAAIYGGGSSIDGLAPEQEFRVKFEVLRQLHAEKAEELPTQAWRAGPDTDQRIYLIDHLELRRFYGRTIGILAHSHWWPISKVERELSRFLGALPPYTRSEVDLLKLAALLRVADVIHLDSRRAPFFWRALENPIGASAYHWSFQQRLGFPRLQGDGLVFTAGAPFELKDADAWWLAFDVLAMADRELADADRVLRSNDRVGLSARRVDGVDNPSEMARHIPVSGWQPVDTRLRVSDIPKIVRTFGGERLYGADPNVPVRELLQNAIDAIQARRLLQGRGPEWGVITVELTERNGVVWLSVEDTGVGMSEAVLTGSLLDFGTSFWGSARMVEELPGLAAKGMSSLGRFGIGFFSVFMLGDQVRVITRRPDRDERDALLLEFNNGINSRPILSKASPERVPADGGTRVEIRLRRDPRVPKGIALREPPKLDFASSFGTPTIFASLSDLIGCIAPAVPVSIDVLQFGASARAVTANDWLTVSPQDLLRRIHSRIDASPYLRMIREIRNDQGKIVGRGALFPGLYLSGNDGVLVSGGLRISGYPNWIGVLLGDVSKTDRQVGRTYLSEKATAEWASSQVRSVRRAKLDAEEKARFANLALEYGTSVEGLPIAKVKGNWLSTASLFKELNNMTEIVLIHGGITYDDDIDGVLKWEFEQYFKPRDELVFLPNLRGAFGKPDGSMLGSYVQALCDHAWGRCEQYEEEDRLVGYVDEVEIRRTITVFSKAQPSSQAREN
jgi:hypothetical protein